MTDHRARYGPHNVDETYVAHEIAEQLVDLGEIAMNYATVGDPGSPALLLIPGQTESWWGLLTLTTLDHLHYGSDFPFTPEPVVAAATERIDDIDSLVDTLRSNAARLFSARTAQ